MTERDLHRPQDAGASVLKVEHPSHDVHVEISKRLNAANNDYTALNAHDRNFLRAYEFDACLLNSGFDGFFTNVSTPQAWTETELALSDVGAYEWADLLGRLLGAERETLHQCYAEGEAIEDIDNYGAGLEIWDEWAAKFWAARAGSDFNTKITFMESLLDEYAIKHFQS